MSDVGSTTYMNKRHAKPARSPTTPTSDDVNPGDSHKAYILELDSLTKQIKANYRKLEKCLKTSQTYRTPELEIQHIVDPETKEKIYYLEVNNRGFEEDLVGKDKEPIEALRNLHGNIEGKLEDARKGRKGQKIKGQRLIDVEVAESE